MEQTRKGLDYGPEEVQKLVDDVLMDYQKERSTVSRIRKR